MRYWAECGCFFSECRQHFQSTGSLLPSSRFLAKTLVTEVRKPRGPARILEVGPGTGSVTRAIARCLQPGDRLDAVEINGRFVEMMRRRLDTDKVLRLHRDQIEVIHAGVEELIGDGVYDFIISGLPLNNFPVALVRKIFAAYDRLLKPGGTLSYYEYALIRQLKTPFVDRRERRRLYRVGRVVGKYIRAHQIRRQRVLMNVPPAVVRHLRLRPTTGEAERGRGVPVGTERPLQVVSTKVLSTLL
jgi:phosphatidylethanolamine/phosphatidyl-N-methylethanolamine N-methyltransferase